MLLRKHAGVLATRLRACALVAPARLRKIACGIDSHFTPYETDAGSVKLYLHLFHRYRFRRHFPQPVLTTKKADILTHKLRMSVAFLTLK